ncbi:MULTISPECIES: 7,8-didemethyl-8-hydroxy-5-deazariboflavin synthase subunit CofH [unclassified Synechocystis]|uniref:7,8-didemethyl-8-hydroxy-5-deazariboflavin synthase subunit CofH n=1 Tax=unclassified Synechocystis TaxID=2640012 RepID=UPI000540856F|nr:MULTISPECIES: 7,8-didemethyl-8-hydroxy-5-deazariboflavin synthase subunit CofH [unclassified Synechocystis]AIE72844.2 7,8-didemethyl-8-hydroxy-5-deazariboflavin synthase subunit 2 [Synechocystis sp. PCC 6714]MCT0252667.1 7,8-didemethyl-8-hydroxy-5-deazariboflavin synthase subunit CofH [Synechocystis sp. CS-94]
MVSSAVHLNLIEDLAAQALALQDLTPQQGLTLLQCDDPEGWEVIRQYGDRLRRQLVGQTVTYVVNRNINFTNICEQHCNFCAFRRDDGQTGAYWLNESEIVSKTKAAIAQGATEICLQGGLNPQAKINGSSVAYYVNLVETIKGQCSQLHLHGFSPQEIQFMARQDGLTYGEVLTRLKSAGLDSLPGTAAEVLVDPVRRIICPEKIDSQTWLDIVGLAHSHGLPTTSTLMAGHVETPEDIIIHLDRLRQRQQASLDQGYPARITEFILLPFVGENAPPSLRKRVGRDQPDLNQALQITAIARLYLGQWIVNHQPSWVKLGLEGATTALNWGCNDLGGTLMEEHITTMAGAKGGTCLTVDQLQDAIIAAGRPHQQRTTLYQPVPKNTVQEKIIV